MTCKGDIEPASRLFEPPAGSPCLGNSFWRQARILAAGIELPKIPLALPMADKNQGGGLRHRLSLHHLGTCKPVAGEDIAGIDNEPGMAGNQRIVDRIMIGGN